MKKTLLAAALAVGFAGVAQAETSVTLYGILDTGIGYERQKAPVTTFGGTYDPETGDITGVTATTSVGKRTKTGLRNGVQSGNRWGLKGSEDLGNGLRAVFQLESGFDSSTGHHQQGDRLFGRHATLGLASDAWGQLDFGRQTNIGSKYLPGIIDPFGGGFGQANAGAAFGAIDTVRYDNMILYQTPNFSGFQFGIGYSFNTDGSQAYKYKGSDDTNIRAITTGIRYANGPIGIALTYDQKKNSSNTGNADTTAKQWNLGAAYDFEVVKVSAGFGQTRNGSFGGSYGWGGGIALDSALRAQLVANGFDTADIDEVLDEFNAGIGVAEFDKGFKSNSFMVGLSAPVGAGRVLASWHMVDPRSNPDRIGSDVWDMEKQQTYSLGYTYPLSKRTNVYAYGSYAKNQDFIEDNKTTLVGVGLRHQF